MSAGKLDSLESMCSASDAADGQVPGGYLGVRGWGGGGVYLVGFRIGMLSTAHRLETLRG